MGIGVRIFAAKWRFGLTKQMLRCFALASAASAFLSTPVDAAAQCLLCSGPVAPALTVQGQPGEVERPLRVEITADLDFSRLVARDGGGSVTIPSQGGQGQAQGNVSAIGGFGFSGRVRVEGSPGRAVRITLPREADLTSAQGGQAHVRDIESSLPPVARLGADGVLEFSFGGRLELNGTADGDYRGRIDVTVAYE
jgi:hypothetical protein